MQQYLDLCQRIIDDGEWVENERTGKRCLTVINADLVYDVGANEFPMDTCRKSYYKQALGEVLGYWKGYSNAVTEFSEKLGCNSWIANANENESWLKNPNRKGDGDMGFAYGAVAKHFPKPDGGEIDLFKKVYNNLKKGIDDRSEIVTFYHPGSFHLACLRPCMFMHHFSLLGDTLYLHSYQRSCDVPLGLNWNMMQCFVMLKLMAQITGHKPGKVFHKIVNAHIYEDQLALMKEVHLKRKPFKQPTLEINPEIKTLEDIERWVTPDDFKVEGYQCHPAIDYPFSV